MFISKDFTLNGISNEDKDVILVTFDSEVLNSVGVPFSRSISANDGYSNLNPGFKKEENSPDDVTLNLMYVDSKNIPLVWTENKILEIKKWIISDDFIPFISEDNPNYINYLMCTKIENKMTPNKIGVLECTFKPLSHFKYKQHSVKMNTSTNPTGLIENPSIYSYKPIVKIKNLGNESTINKINLFEIKGLAKNETVIIDNLMTTVLTSDDINKFSLCNREWLELIPGDNNISISGNCEVEILCEFPIVL